jgi:hypothetical protein
MFMNLRRKVGVLKGLKVARWPSISSIRSLEISVVCGVLGHTEVLS